MIVFFKVFSSCDFVSDIPRKLYYKCGLTTSILLLFFLYLCCHKGKNYIVKNSLTKISNNYVCSRGKQDCKRIAICDGQFTVRTDCWVVCDEYCFKSNANE